MGEHEFLFGFPPEAVSFGGVVGGDVYVDAAFVCDGLCGHVFGYDEFGAESSEEFSAELFCLWAGACVAAAEVEVGIYFFGEAG